MGHLSYFLPLFVKNLAHVDITLPTFLAYTTVLSLGDIGKARSYTNGADSLESESGGGNFNKSSQVELSHWTCSSSPMMTEMRLHQRPELTLKKDYKY